MGCGSCGTKADGSPSGCQSHGHCASGGCNRMNVHDWLANLPFSDPESNCKIVEVSFNNGSRKDYFKNTTLHYYAKGEMVAVEGVNGFDVGMVNLGIAVDIWRGVRVVIRYVEFEFVGHILPKS